MRPFAPLAILLLTACIDLGQNAADAGADGASKPPASDGSTSTAPTSTGADCITEPGVATPLCASISTCPGLVVERSVFPHCGFVAGGTAIDLRCACDRFSCPMGRPATCGDAKALLETTSEGAVCVGEAQGLCTGG